MKLTGNCIALLLLCCTVLSSKKQLEVIEMHSSGEFFHSKAQGTVKFERTCWLIYNNEYRLYIEPYIHLRSRNTLDSDEKSAEVIEKDTTYLAYVFIEGAKRGLEYDLSKPNYGIPIKFNVDSMIEEVTFNKRAAESFNLELGEPVEKVRKGKKLVEKYLTEKAGMLDVDSIYRYYDESLKDVKFSFSPNLDAKKKSKLYKTRYIHNLIPKGTSNPDFEIPRREVFYEFKLIKNKDLTEYQRIIDRFKLDNKAK